jgi:dephospho-CoA kinase
MLKIALTGGIATGKSYVLARFRQHGVPCLDADELAHGVTAAETEATTAIVARFGTDILAADGSVDRRKLGPIVFADPAARRELEAITHPAVYRAIQAGLRAFELMGEDAFAIVDVPLLFETGAEKNFDKVIVTTCPTATQLARLTARGLGEEAARQRLAAQWPSEKKTARADFVVDTGGTFEDTNRQVDEIYRALKT